MEKPISVHDLPQLPAAILQAPNMVCARHVSFADFLKLFNESVHEKIRSAALADGATHVLCMENLDTWSPQGGHRTALVVGHNQTYTLEKALSSPYFRLGDLPIHYQWPVAYASVPG